MAARELDYAMNSSQNLASYPERQPHDSEEDYKAPYDDLIDQYAAPYATTNVHQTYTVDAPMSPTRKHRPGLSHSASHKMSYSTDFESKGVVDDASRTYPPPLPTFEKDTRSFWSKVLPESLACRLYVLTILVETAIDLAIEADLFLRIQAARDADPDSTDDVTAEKMPVYLSIFAMAHVFQFAMACDAVYNRNTLQFILLTVFNALFLVYAVIQISEIHTVINEMRLPAGFSHIPIDYLTTIIPIVISVAEMAYMFLGWKIYNEFGWKVYKFLGADRKIKRMFGRYQIFECLVKFDVFFFVGFSVQFIWLVLHQDKNWEYYITCAALPLSLVLLVEGHLAARHENRWMMATFMSGCVGALVYFFYKLVKVVMLKSTPSFVSIWKSLTTFSIIAIFLLLITFVLGCMVMSNFDRGLKEHMNKNKKSFGSHGRWASQHLNNAMSANPNRMSID